MDGNPLAIELAAARSGTMPRSAPLAENLIARLSLLADRGHAGVARHQTLRALIDWSYDLLAPAAQRVSSSASPCLPAAATLATVPLVCGDGFENDDAEVLESLTLLVDKSLLTVDFSGARPRYRFLESFRQHAYEKLVARGIEAVARRHAHASLAVAQRLERAHDWNPEDVEPELENARSAIEWAIAAGEASLATRIACGFTPIWRTSRGDAQPRRWLEALIPKLDMRADPEIAAYAWRSLARLRQGTQKIAAAERAIALATACEKPADRVAGICLLAYGLVDAGRLDEAESANATAMAICREYDLLETRCYATAAEVRCIRRRATGTLRRSKEVVYGSARVDATFW